MLTIPGAVVGPALRLIRANRAFVSEAGARRRIRERTLRPASYGPPSTLRSDVRVDTGGLKSMLRGGSGEMLQMAFTGEGYVLVQPSESVQDGSHRSAGQSGGGGLGGNLGNLLGG